MTDASEWARATSHFVCSTTYLAPDIVRALLKGRQPIELTPTRLLRLSKDLPHDWSEQRHFLGGTPLLLLRAGPAFLTEMSQSCRGVRIRLDFCRKGRIAMCVGRWIWLPAGALRARPAMCGALGRASVNSGAAN
jgi:hypothetical protein